MKPLYSFCGILILLLISDCRKGPEDPFFSFNSRLHRVCGVWQITKFTVNSVDSLQRLVDSVVTDGNCGLQTDEYINVYNYTWTFDKDGRFTEKLILIKQHSIDFFCCEMVCPDSFEEDSFLINTNSNWSFAGATADYKNKEQLYIYNPASAQPQLFTIIELREKEMKLETEFFDSVSNQVMVKSYTLSLVR